MGAVALSTHGGAPADRATTRRLSFRRRRCSPGPPGGTIRAQVCGGFVKDPIIPIFTTLGPLPLSLEAPLFGFIHRQVLGKILCFYPPCCPAEPRSSLLGTPSRTGNASPSRRDNSHVGGRRVVLLLVAIGIDIIAVILTPIGDADSADLNGETRRGWRARSPHRCVPAHVATASSESYQTQRYHHQRTQQQRQQK